mgnify:CR=1 FL=1
MHSAHFKSERKKRESMIGENIRNARKAAGMSQAELAERLNVRQKDVSRWENGAHIPSLETFAEICRQLNASADEILGLKQND